MFVGQPSTLPKSRASFRCSIREGWGLCLKHKARLEMPDNDKHSNLLRTFVNYGRKKFYNIGPWSHFIALLKPGGLGIQQTLLKPR
jgi:hypothetical protein